MPAKPINKLLATETELLADARRVRVICSTESVDRMGDVIVQGGIDLAAYRKNPVVLWGHDSDVPVAKAVEIGVEGGKLKAMVEFPAEGADADADRVYGKIKAGLVNAASVGFVPLDFEPIDPREPWGGFKFTKSELLEVSLVSIPANKDCLIVGRSIYAAEKAPMMDPAECPMGDECPMREGKGACAHLTREQTARIMALPAMFRDLAKKLPDKAHGARGQLLRCANIAAREIGAEVEREQTVQTPALDEFRKRLDALKRKVG